MQVAVDGPSGSGKSTISKIVAEKYGLTYLDTGAMYRAAAWLQLHYGFSDKELESVLCGTEFLFSENGKKLSLHLPDGKTDDVSDAVRTPEVTAVVSGVSARREIRSLLTSKQREIASGTDVIMDGRDIGTVVLPGAELKFFLTASPEERAGRRASEWRRKGLNPDYSEVLKSIIERDKQDSTRAEAPLVKAPDAVEIDTTCLTINEVVGIIGAAIDDLNIDTGVK